MSYVSSLLKLRRAREEKPDVKELAEIEAFARFAAEPYYEIFMKRLEQKALHEGLGLTDSEALRVSQGKREAFLEIIKDNKRLEMIARERLGSEPAEE